MHDPFSSGHSKALLGEDGCLGVVFGVVAEKFTLCPWHLNNMGGGAQGKILQEGPTGCHDLLHTEESHHE